jgi:RNA polymerase sigma-70 factor (ECF subfamily)
MARINEFEALVRSHADSLYRFAWCLTGAEDWACALTQRTFNRYAARGHEARDPNGVKAWLFTTLHCEFMRQQQRRPGHAGGKPSDQECQGQSSATQSLGAALARLEADCRASLGLFFLETFSIKEIARILGLSPEAVQERIARGLPPMHALLAAETGADRTPAQPLSAESQQGKDILLFYRPGDTALPPPSFQAALEQSLRDPALADWFQQHRTVQEALAQWFRSSPVPTGLGERVRASRAAAERFLLVPYAAWRAVAVCGFLVAVSWTAWLGWPHASEFAAYRQRMVRVALREYRMDILTNDVGAIRECLRDHDGHTDFVLPKGLETVPCTGGAVLTWRGERASLICFNLGPREVCLFVIDRQAVPDSPDSLNPKFERVGKLMTASWSVGAKAYLLAAADEAFVRRFF